MATWDLRRLQMFLEKHEPQSLYLVFGEETFLLDEAQVLLKDKTLRDGAIDFNFDRLYATDSSASQVRDIVETLPVMCPRRLVIYKGVHNLKDKDWEVLTPLLEDPVDSCTFVLIADRVDKRKKYFKKIADKGVVVELKRPFENQIPAWIEYIAFQNEVDLDAEGVRLIHQMVGGSLTEINNELKKLKQYLGDKKKPSAEDILHVVSQVRIDSIFDLANAIGKRDRAGALTYLANLLESGENEMAVVALILRHIRILAAVKDGMKQGLVGGRLGARAGVSSFFLKQYMEQARAWSDEKIARTIEALHQTDKALKSSPVSSHIWLENFILQTCR